MCGLLNGQSQARGEVVQTSDPAHAHLLEQQSDFDLKMSVNAEYAARNNLVANDPQPMGNGVTRYTARSATATPQRQDRPRGLDFLPLLTDGYGPNAERRLRDTLGDITIDNDMCSDAFIEAGLRPPMTLMLEVGLVIGSAQWLTTPDGARTAGVTEEARQDAIRRGAIGSTQVQAFTHRDHDGRRLTLDGRPRIFLNASAFGGGQLTLREVLVHELIHAAGQPPTSNILGVHDLKGYRFYDRIMNACK